uniref:Uncharacterized protein n=1 Tax=Pithovirus LCPAC001 TaxID=2506585 RepID=A0A481Z3J4_9VIRU|nr:MAG: hypothetical protein LCPAC001_01180 [Pithovirus LCPAC001]
MYISTGYTIYINKNTTIKTDCIENNGTIIFNGTFKSGDTFIPIISNCTTNPNINVIRLPKCVTVIQTVVKSGYNNLFKMEFLDDLSSPGCLVSAQISSNNYIVPIIITISICVLVIFFILLYIFNNNFKKKVSPFKFRSNVETSISSEEDSEELDFAIDSESL